MPSAPLRACVSASFDRASYLRAADGHLFCLLAPDLPRQPWGVTLAATPAPLSQLLPAGALAQSTDGGLEFPGHGVSIGLSDAAPWRDDTIGRTDPESDLGGRRLAVMQGLARHGWPGLAAILAPRPARAVSRFEAACRQRAATAADALAAPATAGDVRAALDAARPLLGLGSGLTPAGDDFLVGFLAGLYGAAGTDRSRHRFLRSFGPSVGRLAATATTDVARLIVAHAGRGHFAEPVVAVAAGAGEDAVETLLAFGATSGADCLAGTVTAWRTV